MASGAISHKVYVDYTYDPIIYALELRVFVCHFCELFTLWGHIFFYTSFTIIYYLYITQKKKKNKNNIQHGTIIKF